MTENNQNAAGRSDPLNSHALAAESALPVDVPNVDLADAEHRLCRLFESLGIDPRPRRSALLEPYLASARIHVLTHPELDPAVVALAEAERDLGDWFAEILGEARPPSAPPLMVGRAAFLLAGGPDAAGDLLLAPPAELEPAFVLRLQANLPQATPPEAPDAMPHQPYAVWSAKEVLARALALDRNAVQAFALLVWREGRALIATAPRDGGMGRGR
jgi:hypothetical protein